MYVGAVLLGRSRFYVWVGRDGFYKGDVWDDLDWKTSLFSFPVSILAFKTIKHSHYLFAANMTYKNTLLKLAFVFPALSLSFALETRQQTSEPGTWHPALESDGTQATSTEFSLSAHHTDILNSTRPMPNDEHPSEPRLPPSRRHEFDGRHRNQRAERRS